MRKEKRNLIRFIKPICALIATFALIFGMQVTLSAEESESLNVGDVIPEEMAPDYKGGNSETENEETDTQGGEIKPFEGNNEATDSDDGDYESPMVTDKESYTSEKDKGNSQLNQAAKEINLFDELYHALEENADKVLAGLAFIGTVIVGFAYKSGLMPLLKDALSKLKNSIDKLSEANELAKVSADTDLSQIKGELASISNSLDGMRWQYENFDSLCKEREKHGRIMLEQIDMLYAIFMASALPQYQKEEVGEKIKKMREELSSYESVEEM